MNWHKTRCDSCKTPLSSLTDRPPNNAFTLMCKPCANTANEHRALEHRYYHINCEVCKRPSLIWTDDSFRTANIRHRKCAKQEAGFKRGQHYPPSEWHSR